MTLERQIKNEALRLGCDAVGITHAAPICETDVERLHSWLASGCAGQMRYLQRNVEKRISPEALLDGAKSVIVVAINYKPAQNSDVRTQDESLGVVAQYARYDDYHVVLKTILNKLAVFIGSLFDEPLRFKACVDSAPVAERALAVRAGLGFIGRNHMLIHPTLGPQVFLGELLITMPLQTDSPTTSDCGDCRRCIHACPTGALQADGGFDARRCISYLTIEHEGEIDPTLTDAFGNRLFGCDECVLACPLREAAPCATNHDLRYHADRASIDLRERLPLDKEGFETRFEGSPLLRSGLDRLRRNARICIENAKAR